MKNNPFLPAWGYLLICAFLTLLGCAKPNIQIPELMPPIIKEYKQVTILASDLMIKDTGIYLEAGDTYSILATGRIVRRMESSINDIRPEMGWP